MLLRPAQYLLRIDDLCPTVSAERWRSLAAIIQELRLQPILAVVPENRDPELEQSPASPGFWAAMREMEAAGAAIALHGFRHICASRGRSLGGLARTSEFAGVDAVTQREWIREGLRILRGHGLNPKMWVAPRHGFDSHTLLALKAEGIPILSDGLARMPFVRDGLTWIPQQLWAPCEKAKGLWTICVHPNTVREQDVKALRGFIRDHRGQFTSVDRVLAEYPPCQLTVGEALHARLALMRIQIRQRLTAVPGSMWHR